MQFTIKEVCSNKMNRVMVKHHYLHRLIIRSKLLAYGVYNTSDQLVGGLIWAAAPMQCKRGLFGFPGLPDKWEVLTLARFYLGNGSNLIASDVLSECIGKAVKSGKHGRILKPRGWRLQEDWVTKHAPPFPKNPFVPRLLLSWSDLALPTVEHCVICERKHNGQHTGIIYRATGWKPFDITKNVRRRTSLEHQAHPGNKQSWILPIAENCQAHALGLLAHQRVFGSNAV